jgi:hypothetical protein
MRRDRCRVHAVSAAVSAGASVSSIRQQQQQQQLRRQQQEQQQQEQQQQAAAACTQQLITCAGTSASLTLIMVCSSELLSGRGFEAGALRVYGCSSAVVFVDAVVDAAALCCTWCGWRRSRCKSSRVRGLWGWGWCCCCCWRGRPPPPGPAPPALRNGRCCCLCTDSPAIVADAGAVEADDASPRKASRRTS